MPCASTFPSREGFTNRRLALPPEVSTAILERCSASPPHLRALRRRRRLEGAPDLEILRPALRPRRNYRREMLFADDRYLNSTIRHPQHRNLKSTKDST